MNANDLQKRATVLVVDDEARNVKLFETLLHAEGYATLVAANGSEAIALAETAQPDLILLDVMMPDMDGFETVARLNPGKRPRRAGTFRPGGAGLLFCACPEFGAIYERLADV